MQIRKRGRLAIKELLRPSMFLALCFLQCRWIPLPTEFETHNSISTRMSFALASSWLLRTKLDELPMKARVLSKSEVVRSEAIQDNAFGSKARLIYLPSTKRLSDPNLISASSFHLEEAALFHIRRPVSTRDNPDENASFTPCHMPRILSTFYLPTQCNHFRHLTFVLYIFFNSSNLSFNPSYSSLSSQLSLAFPRIPLTALRAFILHPFSTSPLPSCFSCWP